MHYRATTIFSTDIRLSHYLVDSDIQDETNVLVCESATSAVNGARLHFALNVILNIKNYFHKFCPFVSIDKY